MNVFFYSTALLLLSSFLLTEGIFSGGTITVSAGGLLLAGLAVKAIAGIGLLAASRGRGRGGKSSGGKSRHGRSANAPMDLAEILNQAAIEDEGDCAKKFVCEVHAKAVASLDELEQGVYTLFQSGETIDVAKDTVQFDLAALVGKKAGYQQCQKVYARCNMDSNDLKAAALRR